MFCILSNGVAVLGSEKKHTVGLAQGNGAAPPGFLVVCTLMRNAYKRLGHGVNFACPWSGDVFYLTAVLFVDDSDLFHLAELSDTDDDFFERIQEATFEWGGLVQATGGLLKPSKCFRYMLSWRSLFCSAYRNSHLPPYGFPHPDGDPVPIPLHPIDHPEKKWVCGQRLVVTLGTMYLN